MISSFKLRIALLSALLSGAMICIFAGVAYWVVKDSRIKKIAQELTDHAEREVRRIRSFEDWQRMESKLEQGFGIKREDYFFLWIGDAHGKEIYRSSAVDFAIDVHQLPWPQNHPPPRPQVKELEMEESPSRQARPASMYLPYQQHGQSWHLGLAAYKDRYVVLGVHDEGLHSELRTIRYAFFIAFPLTLLCTGFGAWLFSGKAIQPIHRLTKITRHISAQKLNQRIQLKNEDHEFIELIRVFNEMLERLERSFYQAQRFSADAAHELKTPLSIIQGQIEHMMVIAEPGSLLQTNLSSLLDEVRRLSSISRKLLLLSQADAGRLKLHLETIHLSTMLEELAEDIHLLAPHLKQSADIQPDIQVQADLDLLPQVFHNLISNAIKYNCASGWIGITMTVEHSMVIIQIANTSSGIPSSAQAHLFDRFFRADSAHNRKVDGTGLGLSVSREIARAHGGDITYQQQANQVVEFTVSLPLSPSAKKPSRS